jgi:hypothetical protein
MQNVGESPISVIVVAPTQRIAIAAGERVLLNLSLLKLNDG